MIILAIFKNILWLFLSFSQNECSGIESTRIRFQNIKTEQDLKELEQNIKNSKCELEQPYYYAVLTMKAKYAFWPNQKLSFFNEGKKSLEKYIKRFPNNCEARFLRYSIQQNAPSFLGYTDDLETDKNFILKNIEKAELTPKYKQQILEVLKK